MNVASYDNYMLSNSYLTFCFLLFSFSYDNLIAIWCIHIANKVIRGDWLLQTAKITDKDYGAQKQFMLGAA